MNTLEPVADKTLRVVEIFRSIQGEGINQGQQVVFIRLAGCNLKCSFCDTNHTETAVYTVEQIFDKVLELWVEPKTGCGAIPATIVWTGGEPTLQLTDDITNYFRERGCYQYIESNGTGVLPHHLNHVTISPKNEGYDAGKGLGYLFKNYKGSDLANVMLEIRVPVKYINYVPLHMQVNRVGYAFDRYRDTYMDIQYIVSPVFPDIKNFEGIYEAEQQQKIAFQQNLNLCLEVIRRNPNIRLSVQLHKFLNIP